MAIVNWTNLMTNREKKIFEVISVADMIQDESGESHTTVTVLEFKDFDKACEYYEVYEKEGEREYTEFVQDVLDLHDFSNLTPGGTSYSYQVKMINMSVIVVLETISLNI